MRWAALVVVGAVLVGCGSGDGGDLGAEESNDPHADGMHFADPGINGFVETGEDELSTFAVDVDTAAYTMARRYVTDGSLPPPSSVRVEEFVNFFDPDYPAPAEEAFAIAVDGAPTPFTSDADNYLLRIGLQSRVPTPETRRRATLTFVVDVSGSMAEQNRLGLVRGSLELLVEQLRPDDTVSVVAYGDTARVVLHPTAVARRSRIVRAIASLQPEGATNAEAGLRLAYDVARESFRSGDINRVVLASDGVANIGVTSPRAMLRAVGQDATQGIQLVTVGVGMGNYNDVLMEQLADKGDGFYAYADSFAEAQRVFSETVTTTLDIVALDAKVQVEFDDAVRRYRLVGYENRAVADDRFVDDSVDAGAVGPGHAVTALYEISTDATPPSEATLGTIHVRWTDPATGRPRELAQSFDGSVLKASYTAAAPTFRLATTAAAYAEVLRQSPYAADVTLDEVAREAQEVDDQLPADTQVAEFAALVAAAAELDP
jgi:Ca-activated chloride channel family protein